ncbi:MAG: PKD domain-containing protein [Bacteroidota bacterium]
MKHYLHYLLLSLSFGVLLPNMGWAQAPEQDCPNAIPVCQNIYVQNNSYSGEGLNPNEINSLISCLGAGELNDVWYIFTVSAPGNVCFTITPNNGNDDYDWAVYNLTTANCSDIFNDPTLEVSCNFAPNLGCGGVTGPNGNVGGACGGQNELCIPVLLGETYVVNVSNFSTTQFGYTLDFSASTATIFDNVPPEVDSVSKDCDGNLSIIFSENVICSSVQPTDFTLTGPGGPYVVSAATGGSCVSGTFENQFDLTITPAITTSGTYFLSLVDTVLDNCGNVGIYSTENLIISFPNVQLSASSDTICDGDNLTLNVLPQPGLSYVWSSTLNPNISTSTSFVANPSAPETYTCIATDPIGCADTNTIDVHVWPLPAGTFTVSDTTLCPSESLTATFAGTFGNSAVFTWDFDGGVTNGNGPGPYAVNWTQDGLKNLSLTVEENGCLGPISNQAIQVFQQPNADFNLDADVCIGSLTQVAYSGNASSAANFQWDFDGSLPAVGIGGGPYAVEWPTPGTKNICLTVVENGCISVTNCQPISANALPVVDIVPQDGQCLEGNTFTFDVTSPSLLQGFLWDFGDGSPTSTDPRPIHSYAAPGSRNIGVTVTDIKGCEQNANLQLEVFVPPAADFTFSPGCQDAPINFLDLSFAPNNDPVSLLRWQIGDEPEVTGSNVNLIFSEYGPQGVKLIVETVNGCLDSLTQSVDIYPLPEPAFEVDPVCESLVSSFINLSTIDSTYTSDYLVSYSWVFGDQSPGNAAFEPRHTYPRDGLFFATLTAVSDKGCEASVQEKVEIWPQAEPPLAISDTVCQGDQAFLYGEPGDNTEEIWWFYTQQDTIPFRRFFTFAMDPITSREDFYIAGISERGCLSEKVPIYAEVFDPLQGEIIADKYEVEVPESTINFQWDGNRTPFLYQWSFGDGNTSDEPQPAHTYSELGIFPVSLKLVSAEGCEWENQVYVEVKKVVGIHLPSAFTPNGDGVNDRYEIGTRLLTEISFQVFDRWGQLVFTSNQLDLQWDGRNLKGARLPEGVYIYQMRGTDVQGEQVEQLGTITLFR